jgi:hypothetical protein
MYVIYIIHFFSHRVLQKRLKMMILFCKKMNVYDIKYGEAINYDVISNLPTDQSIPSEQELLLINSLFEEKKTPIKRIVNEAYEPFFVGILFVILSIPKVDEMINLYIPVTQNSIYFLLLTKMFIIMILFWIIKHFHLNLKK